MQNYIKTASSTIKELDGIFFSLNKCIQPCIQLSLHEDNFDEIFLSEEDKESFKNILKHWEKIQKLNPENTLLCDSKKNSRTKHLLSSLKKVEIKKGTKRSRPSPSQKDSSKTSKKQKKEDGTASKKKSKDKTLSTAPSPAISNLQIKEDPLTKNANDNIMETMSEAAHNTPAQEDAVFDAEVAN